MTHIDGDFIRNRITQLRLKKKVSELRMSEDLGLSRSYLQSISSGRSLPRMQQFLRICDYLEIEPKDFFDADQQDEQIQTLVSLSRSLSADAKQQLISLAEYMLREKKSG